MAKIGAVWVKTGVDKEGKPALKHSGKVEIEGKEYWLNLYPSKSANPNAPSFNVYLQPVQEEGIPYEEHELGIPTGW
jgi:hypothetical protein